MYSSILLLYMILSQINTIFWIAIGFISLFILIFWIRYLIKCDSNEITKSDRLNAQLPKSESDSLGVIAIRTYNNIIKKLFISLLIIIVIWALIPKTDYIIGYIALREVDKYAEENPKSIANPKVVFKTVDDIAGLAGKIFNLVDKSVDAASNGLDIANKKLEEVKK